MVHIIPIDYLNHSVLYYVHVAGIHKTFRDLGNNSENYFNIQNDKSLFCKNRVSLSLFNSFVTNFQYTILHKVFRFIFLLHTVTNNIPRSALE